MCAKGRLAGFRSLLCVTSDSVLTHCASVHGVCKGGVVTVPPHSLGGENDVGDNK